MNVGGSLVTSAMCIAGLNHNSLCFPAGRGEFGEVLLAKAQGIDVPGKDAMVLVKALQTRDEQLQMDFRRELDMFSKLNHANVVRLLGQCREAEPHYMILEYMDQVSASYQNFHSPPLVIGVVMLFM